MLNLFFLAALLLPPQIPPQTTETQLPAGAHAVYTTEGRGVQIYHCTRDAAGNTSGYAWTLLAPEATLFDPATHLEKGTHGAGPTWTWMDGSSITGTVLQKTPSPDPRSIPWLLLETKPKGPLAGALTPVKFVSRSETHGGAPPASGCNAQHPDATHRIPYSATYTFYVVPSVPAAPPQDAH